VSDAAKQDHAKEAADSAAQVFWQGRLRTSMSAERYKGCHYFIVPMPDGPGQGCPWCIMAERNRYRAALEKIASTELIPSDKITRVLQFQNIAFDALDVPRNHDLLLP
jgi:hypothetical protein